MALRTVRVAGDPVLTKTCRVVKEVTPRIRDLIGDMLETMYAENGVGLAAPQVGVLKRIVVIDCTGEDPYVFRIPGVKRPVKYIAPEELAAGMRDILRENVSAGRDALYLVVVKMLGYSRVTDTMRERLDQAFELLSEASGR